MKKYLKDNGLYFVLLVAILLIGTGAAIWVQFLKGDVLNLALLGDFKKLFVTGGLLFLAILLEILLMYGQSLVENKIDFLCSKSLKEDIFRATLYQDYATFKGKSLGEYTAKFTTELDALRQAYLNSLFLLFMFVIKILFVTTALIWLNGQLALITLFLLTMPLYVPKVVEKVLIKNQNRYLKEMEGFLGRVNNYLECFELIKNYGVEQNMLKQFKKVNTKAMEAALKKHNTSSLVRMLSTCMSYFSYFVILIFSAYLVVDGRFDAGEFFVAINMIDQLSYPLIALSGCIQSMVSVKEVDAKVTAYCQSAYTYHSMQTSKIPAFKNSLALKHVSFSYEEGCPILEDISLSFQKGKKYLIKGQSGVGKTTLINLLVNYYEPTKGDIYIDHVTPVDKNNIYQLATVVRQDNLILNDTIRNNLTLYQTMSEEKLISVLKQVQLDQFATAEGLDMLIGDGGNGLSGGQRKRLCIARALLFQKDILILDEPLAHLDRENMLKLEQEILGLKNVTVIVVSHIISQEAEKAFDEVIRLGDAYYLANRLI